MPSVVRSMMRQRALVERDMAVPDGLTGRTVPDWQTHIAALPCWLWTQVGGVQAEDPQAHKTVVLSGLKMMIPDGTDITEKDRISGVVDRAGNAIYSGVLNIRQLDPKRREYVELVLEAAR